MAGTFIPLITIEWTVAAFLKFAQGMCDADYERMLQEEKEKEAYERKHGKCCY